jgi:hypothetical protein
MDRLKGIYRYTWAKNQRTIGQVAQLFQAYCDFGAELVALKDLAVVLGTYRDLGRRRIFGVDFLVENGQDPQPVSLTEQLGLIPEAGPDEHDSGCGSSYGFRHSSGIGCRLHATLPYAPNTPHLGEIAWEAAMPAQLHVLHLRVLAPADQLLQACLDATDPGRKTSLLPLADATVVLAECGAEIDWSRFVHMARMAELTERVESVLRYLHEQVGAPLPTSEVFPSPPATLSRHSGEGESAGASWRDPTGFL